MLQFSGGIDSLATLFLKQPEWENITVVWVNTGAAYPDTLELMAAVKAIVPQFVEINSPKSIWELANGAAVDLLPVDRTPLGQAIRGIQRPMFTDYLQCCGANIWYPLAEWAKANGATHIIRGQRNSERRKAPYPIRDGFVDADGVVYEFPVEGWSKEAVFAFCREVCPVFIPEYYATEKTSHDCWDCIAYLDENKQRIANLPSAKRAYVEDRLAKYREALKETSYVY